VIEIDERLADRHACLECGAWQDIPESTCAQCGSNRLEIRERRIWGWVGIQRYLHATDYGIDFLRNGRKILLRDDSLFLWNDPDDASRRGEREYPIEFPRAGRIVGEIHVDHVRVNYQKNAFEYETPDWKRVVRVLRGEGPLQPKRAVAAGYTARNTSPLARLHTGYRRNEAGLKCLIPGDGKNALHERAKEWADRFRKGDPEFQTDEKWYRAAQQHDQPPAGPNDPITGPGDILGAKGLVPPRVSGGTDAASNPAAENPQPPVPPETEEDRRTRWRENGRRLPDLEAKFGLPGHGAALQVTAWQVHGQRINRPDETDPVPVYVASGKGPKVEVFVDADHPIFAEFAVDTRDLVVIELAEFLRVRDRSERSLSAVFYDLKNKCLPDHKIAGPFLSNTASRILGRIREAMLPVVAGNAAGYWSLLSAEDQGSAERLFALEGGSAPWDDVLGSGEWVDYVPGAALVRLVSARPESFLDGRVFRSAHQRLSDSTARKVSTERIVDFLGDVAVLADTPARRGPEELQRGRLSCLLLEFELVTPEYDNRDAE
jgi:ribosomal protein L40E